MDDPQLIALHAALYVKGGDYHHARDTYFAVSAEHAPPDVVNKTVATCHELARSYTDALDQLLAYLATTEPTWMRDVETARAEKLKRRVAQELKCLTPV